MKTEREGTLDVVACHGVHDTELDRFYGEHPEDRPVYDSQIVYAFNHLIWRKGVKPLLVFSGGLTKSERRCSESRSYIERAKKLGLRVPEQVALEEHALTSVDNLILSLYVFHQNRGTYPESIEVISWEFKRRRFERALDAINAWKPLGHEWPALKFFPVGDLWGAAKKNALQAEDLDCEALEHGIDEYYQSPRAQQLIRDRDVFGSRQLAREAYAGYPLPF